jgi:hypothetical protein
MRKTTVVTFAALAAYSLVVGSVAAQAASKPRPVKKHTRSMTFAYTAGPTTHTAVGLGGVQGCIGALANCFQVDSTRDEKYMSISSTDTTGRSIGLSLYPHTGSNGTGVETFFCGSTKNLRIAGNSSFDLSADTISLDPACAGAGLKGTIIVTLSNLP